MISYLQSKTTYLQHENKLFIWPLAIIDIDNYYLTLNGPIPNKVKKLS